MQHFTTAENILRKFPFIDVVQDSSQHAEITIFATEHSDSLSDNIPAIGSSFAELPFSPFAENETIDVEFIKTDGTLSEIKCPCLNISGNSEISLISHERYLWWENLEVEKEEKEILALLISKKVNGLVYAKKILFLSDKLTLSQIKIRRTNIVDTIKNKDLGAKRILLSSIYE